MPNPEEIVDAVPTPLGFVVTIDGERWKLITSVKHPVMVGRKSEIADTLRRPDKIRQSQTDPTVLLFYKQAFEGRWYCAVVKKLDARAFLITAYPTDAIKEGIQVWPK